MQLIKELKTEVAWVQSYLFDQVPGEAVVGGELQAHLRVDVGRGLAAAAHDQGELQRVGRPDLHGLGLHVADAGAGAGLSRETAEDYNANDAMLITTL